MIELIRTNDLVLISAVEALLAAAQIECHVADRHMSSVEGSIGVLPRRVLVATDYLMRARKLLTDAGLGNVLATT